MADHTERYEAAMHAMQSGVAMEMNYRPQPTEPKHLRVGINSALCDHAALVRILIAKGILTEDEYIAEIADEAEREVARYEESLTDLVGAKITLG